MGVSFELDSGTIDSAADDALSRMPQAQEGFAGPNNEGAADAVDADSSSAPAATPASGDLDSAGVAWDSKIHATGRDGKGVKTAQGTWRKKRQSRVAGATKDTPAPSGSPQNPGAPPQLTEAQKAQCMQAGIVVAECIFQTAQAFGGKEWEPRAKPIDERANMHGAWGHYFIAKGITDMPPGLVLCVALGGYMLPRLTNSGNEFPETRTRMQRLREWVGVRVHRFKERRNAAKNRAKPTREIDVQGAPVQEAPHAVA